MLVFRMTEVKVSYDFTDRDKIFTFVFSTPHGGLTFSLKFIEQNTKTFISSLERCQLYYIMSKKQTPEMNDSVEKDKQDNPLHFRGLTETKQSSLHNS